MTAAPLTAVTVGTTSDASPAMRAYYDCDCWYVNSVLHPRGAVPDVGSDNFRGGYSTQRTWTCAEHPALSVGAGRKTRALKRGEVKKPVANCNPWDVKRAEPG